VSIDFSVNSDSCCIPPYNSISYCISLQMIVVVMDVVEDIITNHEVRTTSVTMFLRIFFENLDQDPVPTWHHFLLTSGGLVCISSTFNL